MDYFALLDKDREAHPERHVAADVSTLDMKREYERLIREDPAFARFALKNERDLATARAEAVPAAGAEYFDRFTESQKKLAGYVCRWMAARAVREASPDDQMKKVILDYRNRALVARIESASDSRIYVTYGAEHIRGIVDLLQAHDPDWRVEAISWISPIEAPVDLEGTF